MSKPFSAPRVFSGWVVVASGFFMNAVLGGTFSSFGIFFPSLEHEFGWSRTIVSSGFTVYLIAFALSSAISGRLADRYNPRVIFIFAAILFGSGMIMFSSMQSADQFHLFAAIAGLGSGATFSIPISEVLRQFRGRPVSGTALSFVICGFGIGILMAPLSNRLIIAFGWRNAYLILGLAFFIIVLISALVFRRDNAEVQDAHGSAVPVRGSASGRRVVKVLATPVYLGLLFATCGYSASNQIVIAHLVLYATDIGISSTVAAAALGLMGGLSVFGRLTAGPLSGKMGLQKSFGLSLLGMAAFMGWLLFLNGAWMLYVFVLLFGIFWGIGAVVQWGVIGEFFGVESVGAIIGITNGVAMFTGAMSPYIAGVLFDATGSYFLVFLATGAIVFTGGLLVILVKKPSRIY